MGETAIRFLSAMLPILVGVNRSGRCSFATLPMRVPAGTTHGPLMNEGILPRDSADMAAEPTNGESERPRSKE